jgi:hypothetical protein
MKFASQRTAKSQNIRRQSTENLIVIHEMPLSDDCVGLWRAISAASLGLSYSETIYTPTPVFCQIQTLYLEDFPVYMCFFSARHYNSPHHLK